MNIVLFGKPGSGKGTQAKFLEKELSLHPICTGDLIRQHMKDETEHGLQFKDHIAKGHLVPSELAFQLVKMEIEDNPYVKGFLFDGSPRTVSEAMDMDALLEEMGKKVDLVLGLEVDDEELLVKRILNRGLTSGRADDTDESIIRERLEEYERKTSPVVDYFKTVGSYRRIKSDDELKNVQQSILTEIKKYEQDSKKS